MKILHAITRLDKGGSSTNTLLSVTGLALKGYDVDLLYGKTNGADEILIKKAKASGVNFIEERYLLRDIHPLKDIAALWRVFLLLKKKRYNILHAHTSKAGLICRIAGKLAGVENIIYTPHGHVFYGYFNKYLTGIIIFAEKILASFTKKIIGLTPAECDEWLSFGVGKKQQYEDIPSGIDFDVLKGIIKGEDSSSVKVKFGIPPDKTLIGSVGRFVAVKGYEFFISAAIEQLEKRDDVVFVLVGSGELERKYARVIADAGFNERFFILPWQDNPASIINAMDIFVLSSINEGMGRVLVEAMYFEKPVIATCVGGVPGLITENEGILVEPGSRDALSEAMNKLLDDPGSWGRLGGRAREKVTGMYSCNVMVDKLDALYKKLAEKK